MTIGGGGTKPGQRGDPAHPRRAAPGLERYPVRAALLKPHPVRAALLELIRRNGAVTATDAARELGGSSGLHSFHLRQLARYGLIEEAPGPRGRVRPWRLAGPRAAGSPEPLAEPGAAGSPEPLAEPGAAGSPEPLAPGLGAVARGLEDESYRRWLEHRDAAPGRWRRDEAFSQVVYLTPEELAGTAEVIRALIAQYRHREDQPAARPAGAAPVAVVTRLFPLLEPGAGPG